MQNTILSEFSQINRWSIPELTSQLTDNAAFRERIFSNLKILSTRETQAQEPLIRKIIQVLPSDLTKQNLPFFLSIFTKIRSQTPVEGQLHSLLMQSIRYGKMDLVIALVEQGARINNHPIFELTPLYEAIADSQEEIALYLISKGADISLKDTQGNDCFHLACMHDCRRVVKRLIAKNFDIKKENGRGNTPIRIALIYKHRELFFELISLGASLKDKDLALVETMRKLDKIQDKCKDPTLNLLSREAWLTFNDCLAKSRGSSLKGIIAEYYYKTGDFERLQEVASPRFDLSAFYNSKSMIDFLCMNKAIYLLKEFVKLDKNSFSYFMKEPSIYPEVMNLLLEEGEIDCYIAMSKNASLTIAEDPVEPVLQKEMKEKNILQVLEILKATDRYDALFVQNSENLMISFLDYAVDQKAFSTINRILASAAKLNIDALSQYYSRAPHHLHVILKELKGYPDAFLVDLFAMAVSKKDLRSCSLILETMQDVNSVGSTSAKTPLYLAVESFNLALVEIVIDKSPNVDIKENKSGNTALHIAFAAGNLPIAAELLTAKGDYLKSNRRMKSPLSMAIANNKINFLISLIRNGLIDASSIINHEGDTLLHFALKHSHYPLAALLLNKGADVNARNSNNQTPVHLLFESSSHENEFNGLFEQFVRLGANFNIEVNGCLLCESLIRKKNIPHLSALIKSGYSLLTMSKVGVPLMELAAHYLSASQMIQLAGEIKDPMEKGIADLIWAYRVRNHHRIAYLIDIWTSNAEGALFIKKLSQIKYLARHIAFAYKFKLIYLFPQNGFFDDLVFFQKLDFLPMLSPADIIATIYTINPPNGARRLYLPYINPIAVPGNERGVHFPIIHALTLLGEKLNRVIGKPELGSFEETIVAEAQQFLCTLENDMIALAASTPFTRFYLIPFIPHMTTWQRRLTIPFLTKLQFGQVLAAASDIDQKIEILESATREQLLSAQASFTPNLEEIEKSLHVLEKEMEALEKNRENSTFLTELESFKKQFCDFHFDQRIQRIKKEISCISKVFARHQIEGWKMSREAFDADIVKMAARQRGLIDRLNEIDEDEEESYTCPILGIIMTDPVLDPTCNAHVDRSYFTSSNFNGLSPFTRKPIDITSLKTDMELKAKIESYLLSKEGSK